MDSTVKFSLRLANNHEWQFIGFDSSEKWLHELASLLRLSPAPSGSNESSRLIFVDSILNGWHPGERLQLPLQSVDIEAPKIGWISRDLGALTILTHPTSSDVICQRRGGNDRDTHIIQMWTALDPVYNKVLDCGGLPLHAALLEQQGRAVLLVGSGGMGKSTCCRRVPSSWRCHCDDETLVVKTEHEGFRVHPFPTWSDHLGKLSDRTWDVQSSFGLVALFFLRRAKADSVEPIGPARAAMFLYQSGIEVMIRNARGAGVDESRALRNKIFGSACALARAIPAFILHISVAGNFWEEIERRF